MHPCYLGRFLWTKRVLSETMHSAFNWAYVYSTALSLRRTNVCTMGCSKYTVTTSIVTLWPCQMHFGQWTSLARFISDTTVPTGAGFRSCALLPQSVPVAQPQTLYCPSLLNCKVQEVMIRYHTFSHNNMGQDFGWINFICIRRIKPTRMWPE